MKKCTKCKNELSENNFGKATKNKDGLKSWCKLCIKESSASYRLQKGEKPRKIILKDGYGKECTKCSIYKIFKAFSPANNSSDGYSSWCVDCKRNENIRTRRDKGVEEKKLRQKKNNLLECLECKLFLKVSNFSKSKRGSFGYISYCKKCVVKRFHSDKERSNKNARNFRAKGTYRPAHRLREHNRRNTIKAVSDGTMIKEVTLVLLSKEKCYYCNFSTPEDKRTLDHVVPLSKGGLHSASNIVMACLSCNSTKKDLNLNEFLEKYINK